MPSGPVAPMRDPTGLLSRVSPAEWPGVGRYRVAREARSKGGYWWVGEEIGKKSQMLVDLKYEERI